MQNLNKILKFRFLNNFVHIGWNIQWIFFAALDIDDKNLNILQKKLKNPDSVSINFFPFSLNKFCSQKFSFDFLGFDIKKFSLFCAFNQYQPFWKIWIYQIFCKKSKKLSFKKKKLCLKFLLKNCNIVWMHIW